MLVAVVAMVVALAVQVVLAVQIAQAVQTIIVLYAHVAQVVINALTVKPVIHNVTQIINSLLIDTNVRQCNFYKIRK